MLDKKPAITPSMTDRVEEPVTRENLRRRMRAQAETMGKAYPHLLTQDFDKVIDDLYPHLREKKHET